MPALDNRRYRVAGSPFVWAVFDIRRGFNIYAPICGKGIVDVSAARSFFDDEVTRL